MERSLGDRHDITVVYVWDWTSLQIPTQLIGSFINKVRTVVVSSIDEQCRECAFVVYCDTRITSAAVTREIEKSPNVDIFHVEAHESAWGICKKLHRFHNDYEHGVIALITANSSSFGPVLTKLSRCGWRVHLFHAEMSPKDFLDYADENWSVENILDDELRGVNSATNFPNTAYVLISELDKEDGTIESLSNSTEQFESRVVYYNEKVAEAVLELKAFDVER
ncbi:hypothetical protein AB6A40_003300 [Gnathostoma spinigerum]|uniref:Uncharacterized protein n=1 Tax=Gnathostoma spinigerum TaxID=75299 RepID=A0ABD6EBN3_9BILA